MDNTGKYLLSSLEARTSIAFAALSGAGTVYFTENSTYTVVSALAGGILGYYWGKYESSKRAPE
jgi:hypothetical protein